MKRREFMGLAGGALAAGAVGVTLGCTSESPVVDIAAPMDAAAFHAARRFVATRFGRIACYERGSGPAALFLHGFPLNGFQWRGVIDRLAAYRRCIAPDFLGLGYTEVASGGAVDPGSQVEMLAELLDTLSVQEVDLVANDSGGAVAQMFLVRYPERVRTLLLTNCDVETDSPPPALMPVIELAREGKFVDAWLVPWVADKELARSQQGLGGLCYADPRTLTDEVIDTYLQPLVAPAQKPHVNAYAVALDPNPLEGIAESLRRSTVPMRVVWGTADMIFSPESPSYLDALFPNSRGVRRLEGSKLFWPEELPDIVASEARALWG